MHHIKILINFHDMEFNCSVKPAVGKNGEKLMIARLSSVSESS